MPSSSRPLWLLTCLLIAAFPVLNFVYWPEMLRSGVLPPESDSIDIPMFGSIGLALIASPFLAGAAWLCLRRYNPEARLAAFRYDRPYRSALATLAFGGLAMLLLLEIAIEISSFLPWYEYLWAVYIALWVPWLFGAESGIYRAA